MCWQQQSPFEACKLKKPLEKLRGDQIASTQRLSKDRRHRGRVTATILNMHSRNSPWLLLAGLTQRCYLIDLRRYSTVGNGRTVGCSIIVFYQKQLVYRTCLQSTKNGFLRLFGVADGILRETPDSLELEIFDATVGILATLPAPTTAVVSEKENG